MHDHLMTEEEQLLKRVIQFFEEINRHDDRQKIADMLGQLRNPFLLVIVGEFNSGKSCFINAMLGQRVMAESSIPTTAKITRLKYAETIEENHITDYYMEMGYPLEMLREINLVDTPGTNSIIQHHQTITETFIHQSELVMFVTSTDRPFSESERKFLELLKGKYDRKIVFLLNKIDIKSDSELAIIHDFIKKNIYKLLDFEPVIIHISALQARIGAENQDESLIASSQMQTVHDFLRTQLSKSERIYLKMASPLKLILKIRDSMEEETSRELNHINEELKDFIFLKQSLARRQEEMEDYFTKYLAEIETVLLKFEHRILDFIEQVMTLKYMLQNRVNIKKIEEDFKTDIIANYHLTETLDEIIADSVEYITKNTRQLWENATTQIEKQMEKTGYVKLTITAQDIDFQEKKKEIMEITRKQMEKSILQFSPGEQSVQFRNDLMESMKHVAIFGGVATAAAIITVVSALIDWSGVAFSLMSGAVGFYILPYRKNQIIQEVQDKISRISEELKDVLERHLKRNLHKTIDEIQTQLQQYMNICVHEREVFMLQKEKLDLLMRDTRNLLNQVENIRN
jgi:small GTP-binding protein